MDTQQNGNFFDLNFYPTPRKVLDRMEIDCLNKVCLEPSAGKGDIVEYLKEYGATDVIAVEQHESLQAILAGKCQILGKDFFEITAQQISHVELIVMNPPFFNAAKHILHAWNIAPQGCEIIALCNWQSLEGRCYGERGELSNIIENNGSIENLGTCFTHAERKTNVEIGLIHIFKPVSSENTNFDGFYFMDDEPPAANGIIQYNEIRSIVNSYVAAVKCYDRFATIADEMNRYTAITDFGSGFTFNVMYKDGGIKTKKDFSRALQKHCWQYVFNKLGVEKYVTRGVMADINNFVENRKTYPFTMKNVYRMIEIIVGTRETTMNKAIVEAIDNFTKHTYENRYCVEGWKTNSGYMLKKKFICGWICEMDWSGGLQLKIWQGNFERVKDLVKALCYISGRNYDTIPDAHDFRKLKSNTWYDWGFFEFKVFKKGTGHFKFKDENIWENLNRTYAKIKGVSLPEKL